MVRIGRNILWRHIQPCLSTVNASYTLPCPRCRTVGRNFHLNTRTRSSASASVIFVKHDSETLGNCLANAWEKKKTSTLTLILTHVSADSLPTFREKEKTIKGSCAFSLQAWPNGAGFSKCAMNMRQKTFYTWVIWKSGTLGHPEISEIPMFIFGFSIEIDFLRHSQSLDKPTCASTILTNSFPRSPSSIFSLGFGRDFTAA